MNTLNGEGRPNLDVILGGLKDFQRKTVDYVFQRLYLDDDAVSRFFIADEVGLGKTLVARGLIAKAIDYLWDDVERIDLRYDRGVAVAFREREPAVETITANGKV